MRLASSRIKNTFPEKNKPGWFLLAVFISLILTGNIYPQISFDPQGLWESTFDCPYWISQMGNPPNCDEWQRQVTGHCQTCTTPQYAQITDSANFISGGGGRGWRHWVGCVGNDNSGGAFLTFPNGVHEYWLRWYVRFENGFPQFTENKMLYFYWGLGGPDFGIVNFPWGDNSIRYYSNAGVTYGSSVGWNWMYGAGQPADGSWWYCEMHIKENTGGAANGILQFWIAPDGGMENLIIDRSDVRFTSTDRGIWRIFFGHNSVNGTGSNLCHYYDFDDVAISISGRIGMVDAPSRPQNVRVEP